MAALRAVAETLLGLARAPRDAHVGFRFVDRPQMVLLNGRYRNKHKSTDILTFCYAEAGLPVMGELVMCLPTILQRVQGMAPKTCWHFAHHCISLLVHGLGHLLGHDHVRFQDFCRMKRFENDLKRRFYSDCRPQSTACRLRRLFVNRGAA